MPSRKKVFLFLAGLCLVLVFASPVFAQKKATGASRAIVTINDDFPGAGAGVLSDGKNSGIYTDSQLTGGDPCVNAFVKADGFFNIQMDFSVDVGSNCNTTLGTGEAARSYLLRFPAGHAACGQFDLAASDGVCTLVLDPNTDEPIIGIPKLFDSNATVSQVRFRFRRKGSYWVVALSNVPVSPAQNPQTVSHIGVAKLFNDDKGRSGGYQVGGEFTFALHITVHRQ